MASTNTTPCEICDGKNEITKKCLTCDEFMCDKCCKIHCSNRQGREHKLIKIEESEKLTALVLYRPKDDQNSDGEDDDEFCDKHHNEKYILYCVTRGCDCLVCSSCITDYHPGHRFVKIDDTLVSYKKYDAKRNREEIEQSVLPYLREKKLEVIESKETVLSDIEDKKETITQRYEQMKKELEEHYLRTISRLGETGKTHMRTLNSLDKILDSHMERLKASLNAPLSDFSNSDPIKSIKQAEKLQTDLENTPEIQVPIFNRMMLNPSSLTITDVFGELQEVIECEPITLSRNAIGFSEVSTVCPISPYAAWYGHYKHRGINLLELDEEQSFIPTGTYGRTGVLNMAATPEGDLYMVNYGSYDVLMLKSDGFVEKVCETKPLVALGIGVTKNRDILVCLADAYPQDMQPDGLRKVIRLTNFGVQRQTIEYDDSGCLIFKYPFRIAENINGDIGVIDHNIEQSEGRLVVLNSEGIVKFNYTGNLQIEGQNCNLTDLTFDSEGCILLSDVTNQTIHMLTKEGSFLRLIDIYVYFGSKIAPTTVAIDTNGCLWVGGVCRHRYVDRNEAYVLRVQYKI